MKKRILFLLVLFSFILFKISNAQIKYNLARSIGTSNGDLGKSIASDANGNVYVTGLLGFGPANFNLNGSTPMSINGEQTYDCFVAKYNTLGECEWAKSFAAGNGGGVFGNTIAVDVNGNVYVAGVFEGTVDFNPTGTNYPLTSSGDGDVFFAKFENDGALQWAKKMGGTSSDFPNGITVAAGYIYIAGAFNGYDFTPEGYTGGALTNAGSEDAFFAKYDTSGNYQWAYSVGGTGQDIVKGIALDGTGNIYLTGTFELTANFNPQGSAPRVSVGQSDIFIAKYNSSGGFVWTQTKGSFSQDEGTAIAVDITGNVYLTGTYKDNIDLGSGSSFIFQGTQNIFLAKYDGSNGNHVWSNIIEGIITADSAFSSSIAVDPTGDVYLTGSFKGTLNLEPPGTTHTLTSSGQEDVFLAKYNTNGIYKWSEKTGGNLKDIGWGITTNGAEGVFLTGSFQGTVDFDEGSGVANRTSIGSNDIFIAKYSQGNSTITGTVSYSNAYPPYMGNHFAKLYTQVMNDGNAAMHLIDSVPTNTGLYTFSNVATGKYFVLASASIDYDSIASTYYGDTTHWQGADTIYTTPNTTATANINMKVYNPNFFTGVARLSGTVKEGNGFDRGPGDPIPGTSVGLEHDPEGIIANATTNSLGYYEFAGVPVGNYTIYVNIPGLPMDSTYKVHVQPTDTLKGDLDFVADSSSIDTMTNLTNSIIKITSSETKIRVFPNPHRGTATIEFTIDKTCIVQLNMYNVLGEKAAELINEQKQPGIVKYRYDAADIGLKPGIYILHLKIDNENSNQKVILIE